MIAKWAQEDVEILDNLLNNNNNNNIDEPTRCNNDLLIYKISSTCFGQYFVHHQEREAKIFTAYGILLFVVVRLDGERQRCT